MIRRKTVGIYIGNSHNTLHTCDKTRRCVVVVPVLGGRGWGRDRHVAVPAGGRGGLSLEVGEGL